MLTICDVFKIPKCFFCFPLIYLFSTLLFHFEIKPILTHNVLTNIIYYHVHSFLLHSTPTLTQGVWQDKNNSFVSLSNNTYWFYPRYQQWTPPLTQPMEKIYLQGAVHNIFSGFLGLVFHRKLERMKILSHRQSDWT